MYFCASMEYNLHTLQNGIRVLHKEYKNSNITHCCLVVNTGSRDETKGKEGLAHFIEHLLFKGTQKRSTYHLLNRIEVVGGELNAYTTKEQTCVHTSFLTEHLDRGVELMSDIIFNSKFPENEMDKEKSVILDEIDSYKDLPEESIQDDFEELIFAGHSLGNNILGTPKSVKSLQREDITHFIKKNYKTSEIILAVYGDYNWNKVKKIAEKYLSIIPKNNSISRRKPVTIYTPQQKIIQKNIFQSHAMMGNRCYHLSDDRKVGMLLLSNYLGGPGMSSKLNMEIREKHGICYSIESNYTPLTDTGLFSIYMGTDKDKMEKCQSLVKKELRKLMTDQLGEVTLHQAKQKFIGQISLAEENRLSVVIAFAKAILDHGSADSLEEIYRKINAVTARQIRDISNEIFDLSLLSSLTFVPK
jgi:predicted Zn-dependent peptidase